MTDWMLKTFMIDEMKEGRTELEFDEFEKLLGEIPIATSGKPHSDDTGPKMVSFEGSLSPISVNSCNGPMSEKLQNFGSLGDRKISSNVTKQLPLLRIQPEEMNLPNDQSLTSAFAGLSFTDGLTAEVGAPLAKSKSLENCSILLDGQHLKGLKKPNSNVDPNVRAILSLQYPRNVTCGFDKVGETKSGQESSNMLKFNAEELKRQVGYRQQFEHFSPTAPLAHAVQGLQFLSHVPVHHGVQFPTMPDQQHFFLDAQSLQPYFHQQQINEPQISWRNTEEEQYYRLHHQYLYLQHLPIQRLEGQHPIQTQGNITTRLTSENLREPLVEVPISCQLENSRQESFWNNSADYRSLNLPNPATSFPNFSAMPVLDKVAKQKFPEKILTRSNGTNTQKNVKFGSVSGNGLLTRVSQNEEEALSNYHHWRDFSIPRTEGFQLNSLGLWGLSTEDADVMSTYLKPVPQKCYSVDEATGRIYLMAKDQHGCRFLQRKLAEGTPTDVEKIFFEIIDYIVELMTDPFGNYLVQKLLEICDGDQRMQILHTITRRSGELVRISCNMHGTRAVQKVIETLETPMQFSMVVSSLKPGIVTLIKNINGNHVAQRCLQCLMPEFTEFLFEAATANCVELATDRHGCCVLQKCLGHSDDKQRRRLVCEITSNALILSQDPYGNYVVQYVFDLRLPWATVDILNQLEGNYSDLSVQKFSSNVVEKCLNYAGEGYLPRVIQELIDNPRLDQIMLDPYGNYVIQAALSQSKGALHNALVAAIIRHEPVLQTSPYGKKVISSCGLKK